MRQGRKSAHKTGTQNAIPDEGVGARLKCLEGSMKDNQTEP